MLQGLENLRVIDFSDNIAGSYATKLLADAGAEVIKVEPPGGDPMRRWSAQGDPCGAVQRAVTADGRERHGQDEVALT